MKLFKRIAAAAMAAALSLTMLTACGGGASSTANSKLGKSVQACARSGQTYMELECDGGDMGKMSYKIAIDKEKMLTVATVQGITLNILEKNSKYYVGMMGMWMEMDASDVEHAQAPDEVIPKEALLASLRVDPEYEVEGKKFYAEIISTNGEELAYCFDGDSLKYIVQKVGNNETVYSAKLESKFPETIQNMLTSFDNWAATQA